MPVVLDTKFESKYKDDITSVYHFPKVYEKLLRSRIGDFVLYREPRDGGGSMAYFAYAILTKITEDPELPSHFYAHVSNFENFPNKVPWTLNDRYWEDRLRQVERRAVGRTLHGKSARFISVEDFEEIAKYGLGISNYTNSEMQKMLPINEDSVTESKIRTVSRILMSRTQRDSRFRNKVINAYDGYCAISKNKMIDSNGNFEAVGAHIQAVADDGPDVIRNGLALSNTVHWMFDRYLISVDEDYKLITANTEIPSKFRDLIEPARTGILLPRNSLDLPGQYYFEKHRQKFHELTSRW